jgi:hypothetical protein
VVSEIDFVGILQEEEAREGKENTLMHISLVPEVSCGDRQRKARYWNSMVIVCR